MFLKNHSEFLRYSRHVWNNYVVVFILLFFTTCSVVVLLDLVAVFTKVQLWYPQILSASFRCLCSFSWAWASARWCRVLITPSLNSSGWWESKTIVLVCVWVSCILQCGGSCPLLCVRHNIQEHLQTKWYRWPWWRPHRGEIPGTDSPPVS